MANWWEVGTQVSPPKPAANNWWSGGTMVAPPPQQPTQPSAVSGNGGTPDSWTQQYAAMASQNPTLAGPLVERPDWWQPVTPSPEPTRQSVDRQRKYEDEQMGLAYGANGIALDNNAMPLDPQLRQYEIQKQRDRVAQDRWWDEAAGVRKAKQDAIQQEIEALGPIYENDQLPQGTNFSSQAALAQNDYKRQQRDKLQRQILALNGYMPSESELRAPGEASERGAIRSSFIPRTLESTAKDVRNTVQQVGGVAASEAAGLMGDEAAQKQMMGFAQRRGQEQQSEQAIQAELDKRGLANERVAGFTRKAAETLGPAAITGGGGLAVYYGSAAYAEAMADGKTRAEAVQNAATEAVMTLAGAKLGAGTATLAGKIAGRNAGRIAGQSTFKQAMGAVKGAVAEVPEEVTTEWLHYMHEVANGRKEYNPEELRGILRDTAIVAGIAGVTPGAVETLVNSGSKLYVVASDYKKALDALDAKLAANQPISRGDLQKAGIPSGGTNAASRVEIAKKELAGQGAPPTPEGGATGIPSTERIDPAANPPVDVYGTANPVSDAEGLAAPTQPPAPAPEQVAPIEVTAFRGTKANATENLGGEFFSPDESVAKDYAGQNGNVEQSTLRFERPFTARNWVAAKQAMGLPAEATMSDVVRTATEAGHDGIVFENHNGLPEYVRLPSQSQEVIPPSPVADPVQQPETLPQNPPVAPDQQGRTGPAGGESFGLQQEPATRPKKEKFTSTPAKQPDLIPDLWRDSIEGQQGLFEEQAAPPTQAKQPAPAKPKAAPVRPRLAGQDFIEQVHKTATAPEEANAIIALAKANAEYRGEDFDDYVGNTFAGVEPAEHKDSRYLKQRGEDPDTLAQAEDRPRWYSQAAKIVNAKMGPKGTSNQVLAMLEKNGVKPEEIEWMGLKELLAATPRTVTKQEVLDAIENGVRVEEVVKGGKDVRASVIAADRLRAAGYGVETMMDDLANVTGFMVTRNGEAVNPRTTPNHQIQQDIELVNNSRPDESNATGTKFSQYTLPGGQNYRELLLTLPNDAKARERESFKRLGELEPNSPEYDAAYERHKADFMAARDAQEYRTNHFDEPNILAHIRFNERTDADGNKVLFIEEVQSDWHQDGRRKGYKEPVADQGNYATWGERQGMSPEEINATWNTQDKRFLEWRANEDRAVQNLSRVPNAPYRKSWPMLAMKRAIQWAAENGFDKIAWTTGETQAKRYPGLSERVSSVRWHKGVSDGDGHWALQVIPVGETEWKTMVGELAPEDLARHVGKEPAEKLIAGQTDDSGYVTLSGIDLQVGGEGMKAFYDSMLPNETNKFVKKFGAKVGRTTLPPVEGSEQSWSNTGSDGMPATSVHAFDITDAMRDSALNDGQPLFQKHNHGGQRKVRGEVQFLKDGRAIIRAFKKHQNAATLAHEIGHVFRRTLLPKDLAAAERAVGLEAGAKWKTEHEEKFARWFERYLRDGKAPNKSLKRVFEKFKGWLTSIYSNLKGTPLEQDIPPELRKVFDKMLSPKKVAKPKLTGIDAIAKKVEDLRAENVLPNDTLDDLDWMLTTHPDVIESVFDTAKKRAKDRNKELDEIKLQWNNANLSQYDPNSMRLAAMGGKKDENTVKGLDLKIDLLEDSFPDLAAWARKEGYGDTGSAMLRFLSAGEAQFKHVSEDHFLPETVEEAARELRKAGGQGPLDQEDDILFQEAERKRKLQESRDPADPRFTSARRVDVDRDRDLLGLEEIDSPETRSWATDLQAAKDTGIPGRALDIAQDVVQKPRALSSTDTAGLVVRAAEIKNAYRELSQQLTDITDPSELAARGGELNRLESEFDTLTLALRTSGTEKGRALAVQKLTINQDYDLVSILNRAKAAKGDNLTPKERADIKEKVGKSDKAQEELDAHERRRQHREVRRLRAAINGLRNAISPSVEGDTEVPGLVDKDREQLAKLKAKLEELDNQLKEGVDPKAGDKVHNRPSEKEVSALDDEIARVRAELRQRIKDGTDSTAVEKKKIAEMEKRLAEAHEKLRKIRAGEPVPSGTKRRPDVMSEQRSKLHYELERARRDIRHALIDMRPKGVWHKVQSATDLSRGLITSIDYSALGRQAKFAAWSHPILAAKAIPTMFRSSWSERRAWEAEQEITSRPNAHLYDLGMTIHRQDSALSDREEAFVSRLVGKIPLVAGSQRAYIAFLNRLRADVFDALAEAHGGDSGLTHEEYKQLGHLINVNTGRGGFAAAESHMRSASLAFFAPRFLLSRIQYALGQPGWHSSNEIRKIVAKEYARTLIGAAVWYGLYAAMWGDDDEFSLTFDPRSPDFGKIVLGDTRLDPLAGLAQVVRFATRMTTGQTVQGGRVKDMSPYDKWQETSRFVRSKASPFIGQALNYGTGADVMGNPVNATSVEGITNLGLGLVAPLSLRDIPDAIEDQGVPRGTAVSILNLFGEGLQVYESQGKYDVWGRANSASAEPTIGDRILDSWNSENPDEPVNIGYPRDYYTYNGKQYQLTEEQYESFQKESGELADKAVRAWMLESAPNILNEGATPTEEQVNAIKSIISDARSATREQFIAKEITGDTRKIAASYRKKARTPRPKRNGLSQEKYQEKLQSWTINRAIAREMVN